MRLLPLFFACFFLVASALPASENSAVLSDEAALALPFFRDHEAWIARANLDYHNRLITIEHRPDGPTLVVPLDRKLRQALDSADEFLLSAYDEMLDKPGEVYTTSAYLYDD